MAFSVRAGTNWCHDFPKLARESGFHFNPHRRKVRVDWNRISSIDVDRVLADRDFSTIDDNVNNVVDYCLESEYDVKILDPNFVKLFRLAQLAVEYLLYCKQYLDHSVVILKEELRSKTEENSTLKNELEARERVVKELRDKLKERSKIIETKLSDSHGEIHKCPRCPKTFVSALFMSAHVSRRHPTASVTSSSSPIHEQYRAETEKLHSEIKSLKERLNLTERVVRNESEKYFSSAVSEDNRESRMVEKNDTQHRLYHEEMDRLKVALLDEIRNLKYGEKNSRGISDVEDHKNIAMEELIRRQEAEIKLLRQRLDAKETKEAEKEETKRDQQTEIWQSKIDDLENRYRADIDKLYTQLKVTQESADGMRIDYLRRISDLERREASVEATREIRLFGGSESLVRDENPATIPQDRENEKTPMDDEEESSSDFSNGKNEKIRREFLKKTSSTPKSARTMRRERKQRETSATKTRNEEKSEKPEKLEKTAGFPSNLRNGRKSSELGISLGKLSDRETKDSTRDIPKKREPISGNIERRKLAFDVSSVEKFSPAKKNWENPATKDEEISESRSESRSSLESESLEDSSGTEDEEEQETKSIDAKDREREGEKFYDRETISRHGLEAFRGRLRELGIDPEWRGIPDATFAQSLEIVRHHRSITSRKYRKFDEIRRTIIHRLSRRLATREKERRRDESNEPTNLERLVTNVRSKVSKALNILDKNDGHCSNNRRISTTDKSLRREKDMTSKSLPGDGPRPRKSRSTISSLVEKKSPYPRGSLTSEDSYENRPVVLHRVEHRPVTDASRKFIDETTATKDPPHHLSHSYESIRDFISDTKAPRTRPNLADNVFVAEKLPNRGSFVQGRRTALDDDFENSPRNNSAKSVLKTTLTGGGGGSAASLSKKKVFFDLETPRKPDEGNSSESDFQLSSIGDEKLQGDRPREDSPGGDKLVLLRTSQSEKIARISQQIEKQLSLSRRKPAGAVEAMFLEKFHLASDETERDANLDTEIDELLKME